MSKKDDKEKALDQLRAARKEQAAYYCEEEDTEFERLNRATIEAEKNVRFGRMRGWS